MLDTKFWKRYFNTYDILNIAIPYIDLMEELVKELDVNSSDIILDAGAGTGNLSTRLIDKVADVVALDSSSEGLDMAKNKSFKLKILVHDLSKPLPFEDSFFTKVVSNNVIYTIPVAERTKIFKEFYRVLKPGGKMIVSNVQDGWKPINIYKSHIRQDLKNVGLLRLIFKIMRMMPSTIKMFYYNSQIKKENKAGDYDFIKPGEQKQLLEETGFKNISDDKLTYADQAIMNSAFK